ncbi:MAG: indole-3-glycerol-phosphate synthase [Thermoanaerobaculia bacterium]
MSAPPDILVEIVRQRLKRLDVESVRAPAEESRRRLGKSQPFLAAIAGPGPSIIAEVKMGSPRIGPLVDRVDPVVQARSYADHGAAALSVVVEPDFFGGSYELLSRCKAVSGLPAIAKDFVVSPLQIDAAREAGADGILLIAALYSAPDLAAWSASARSRGLVPLIETHDASDRAKLAGREWELVGVNNRDLRTFEVSLDHSISAVAELPPEALKVSESGIGSGAEIAHLAEAGFDAFLIGESLLLADDPAARLEELSSGAGAGSQKP